MMHAISVLKATLSVVAMMVSESSVQADDSATKKGYQLVFQTPNGAVGRAGIFASAAEAQKYVDYNNNHVMVEVGSGLFATKPGRSSIRYWAEKVEVPANFQFAD